MRTIIVSFLAFSVLLTAVMLAPPPAQRPSGTRLAQAASGEIRHIRANYAWTDFEGHSDQWSTEFWFDPSTGNARHVTNSADGAPEVVEVRNGRTVLTHWPTEGTAGTEVAADSATPFLTTTENKVLYHQKQLQQGTANVIAQDTVAGELSDVLAYGMGDSDHGDAMHVWVSRSSGLVLKQVLYEQDEIGGRRTVETQTISYPTDEQVQSTSVPANLFSTSVSDAQYHEIQRYQTPATARGFTEFNTFWLGENHEGLPLFGIAYNEILDAVDGRFSSYDVTYHHPFVNGKPVAAGQISIVQRPPLTSMELEQRNEAGENPETAEAVIVNGIPGDLYDEGPGGVRLEITKEGTFITISGDSRGPVLNAAAKLRKLCAQ